MFVRFTRLDGTPIWLNATFVVTVEPRRGGGSVVVPIGDGLDYDVRETPERVLALLEPAGSAPAPAPRPEAVAAELASPSSVVEPAAEPAVPEPIVAVPPPRSLPEKFESVVSAGLSAPQPDEVETDSAAKTVAAEPVKKTARRTRKTKTEDAAAGEGTGPARKTTRKSRKTKEAPTPEPPAEPPAAASAPVVEAPAAVGADRQAPLDEAQIERLRRMSPGSLRKLKNTLASHFRLSDPQTAVEDLLSRGVIRLEQDHVVW